MCSRDLMDPVVLVEQDRHLAVAFDAGHRLDRDAAQVLRLGGCFQGAPSRSLRSIVMQ